MCCRYASEEDLSWDWNLIIEHRRPQGQSIGTILTPPLKHRVRGKQFRNYLPFLM